MSIAKRIEFLEQTPAARRARALTNGDFSELTDAELDAVIAEINAALGSEAIAEIQAMSAAELEALANDPAPTLQEALENARCARLGRLIEAGNPRALELVETARQRKAAAEGAERPEAKP